MTNLKRIRHIPMFGDSNKKILIIDYKDCQPIVYIHFNMWRELADDIDENSVVYFTDSPTKFSTDDEYKYVSLEKLISINPEKWNPFKNNLFDAEK